MTQRRWQQIMDIPLTVAAVIFLIAYAWEVIANLNGVPMLIAEIIIAVTWVVFVFDYAVNLVLAEHRWFWFRKHIFDLFVVVLPMLRPLRLLRLVTLLNVLQRRAGTAVRGGVLTYAVGSSLLLVFVAGLAILDTERSITGSQITNLGDGIWWAFVTITTVGYGDIYPATALGRVIAAGVMVAGIALLGVVTATLASWIVERVAAQDELSHVATRREVTELTDQVNQLKHVLLEHATQMAASSGTPAPSSPTSASGASDPLSKRQPLT
ncbi:voltage-gated potassium channel [Salinibacterium amurskyense]|uniref:Voltage-gated potassium channel n=1 Tax=Salinibacterium amurskyense TaxID=205941 RepID=A0A2M9D7D2_9MICO|nr:potassium channel family protein [Salinibacterium amurskyense]PJJ81627.1 voltage-gated potassium channel [Salinibacterium amurskyense]RLQ83611.1 potassium channel protein [Salinibacterium amurskyense]GHD79855.1 voltage-gated potassium channel [Salinibacterium amurskyense]